MTTRRSRAHICMLRSIGVGACLMLGEADGAPRVAAGVTLGLTLGPSPYFPTFLGGGAGEIDALTTSHFSAGIAARIQLYSHPEEEDYGSWGGQQDLSVAVRLGLFDERDDATRVNVFLSVRAGGAIVERVPFRDSASNEIIGGYLLGGSVGVAFRTENNRPRLRALISFDRPSFTTHDDGVGPVGELSISLMTTFR